jgi:hypothetical protein
MIDINRSAFITITVFLFNHALAFDCSHTRYLPDARLMAPCTGIYGFHTCSTWPSTLRHSTYYADISSIENMQGIQVRAFHLCLNMYMNLNSHLSVFSSVLPCVVIIPRVCRVRIRMLFPSPWRSKSMCPKLCLCPQ